MNCQTVRRTFELEDIDLRPDPTALRRHFATCARCRVEFPEFGMFLPTERERVRPHSLGRAAAAALVLVAASWGLRDHAPQPSLALDAIDRSRPLAYTLVVTNTTVERSRVKSSTLTHQTFRTASRSP